MSKKHHPSQETENGMVRGLQNRHVQLIAIAGTIGTGLFLGAGRSLSLTGPSIILVYMLTGAFMYLMMRAIGEMLYFRDIPVAATINEAVELAKKYSMQEDAAYINGVLGAFAKANRTGDEQ